MILTLLKSVNGSKPGTLYKFPSYQEGMLAVSNGIARHPTVGELATDANESVASIRKRYGEPTIEDEQRARLAAANDKNAKVYRNSGLDRHEKLTK